MIIFYNPISTTPGKQPLPLSLLSLAAVLEGKADWVLVDGNMDKDPAARIISIAQGLPEPSKSLLAVTVMPGPQLSQAVPVCRQVHAAVPELKIVWGGYFPTQHADTILKSPMVDFVIRSQGEQALLDLIEAVEHAGPLGQIHNLSWKDHEKIIHNPLQAPLPPEQLPDLPYHRVNMENYIHPNYLGRRTVAYNSSFGCPFSCNFCAVVAMSNRRWLGQSPAKMEGAIRHLVNAYGVDGVQMHDMDFFVSEPRVAEFCDRIADLNLGWWGLGRIDTLMHYSDSTWAKMKKAGLKMTFSGAESGSDEMLEMMNKGGHASTRMTMDLVKKMGSYGIVPELSFVLGVPPDPVSDMHRTFEFIRKLKRANPATEIIMYIYTPVPFDGALYESAQKVGFHFPETLDEWASEKWREFSMRKGSNIPWMEQAVRKQVHNFERVLNAYYPTVTDMRLKGFHRALLKGLSTWRYQVRFYQMPYELRAVQKVFHYQRPETTGF